METMTQIRLAEPLNIMALLQTLEDNRLSKEKEEVQAFGEQLKRMKENFIKSAKVAVEQCKGKGVAMLRKVVSGMKIPQAIKKLENALSKAQSGVEQQAVKAGAIRQELESIGGHTKNVGKMLIGKEAKEIPADTASIGKVEKFLLRVVKRMEKMEQSAEKTRGTLEQFVMGKQKTSVKPELKQLKRQRIEHRKALALPNKNMER